jgi:drug/metabolite transporter (DMT)-like permease
MKNQKLSPALAWSLFIILALIWGSSFILMKRGLQSFSYSQIGFLRIATAWIFTLMIAFPKLKKWKRKDILPSAIVGYFGNAIPYVLFPLAVTRLDSSLVGILNSLVPLFTLVIGLIWFGVRVKWIGMTGIILGFGGALVLLLPGLDVNPEKLSYGIYPIIATICYAISINVINTKLKDLDSLSITLFSLSTAGPLALIYVLSTDFFEIMETDPQAWVNLGYICILGILGTSLAVIVFNHLIKGTSSLFAASVTYAIPLVALLWGIWDGETIGIEHLIGMLLILAGVYLVNLKGAPADRIRKKLASTKKSRSH